MTTTSRSSRSLLFAVCAAAAVIFIGITLLISARAAGSVPAEISPSVPRPQSSRLHDGPVAAKAPPPTSVKDDVAPALAEPVRPAEMADPTQDGATATAVYFVSLVPYVTLTGDVSAWKELSAPACVTCDETWRYLESAFASGQGMRPSTLDITVEATDGPLPGAPETQVQLSVHERRPAPSKPGPREGAGSDSLTTIWVLNLDPGPHGWVVRDFAVTPDA